MQLRDSVYRFLFQMFEPFVFIVFYRSIGICCSHFPLVFSWRLWYVIQYAVTALRKSISAGSTLLICSLFNVQHSNPYKSTGLSMAVILWNASNIWFGNFIILFLLYSHRTVLTYLALYEYLFHRLYCSLSNTNFSLIQVFYYLKQYFPL